MERLRMQIAADPAGFFGPFGNSVAEVEASCRRFDIAAAQLLLHEGGLPIIFVDAGPFGEGPLDTAARSPVAAAATQQLCEQLAHIIAT